MDQNSLAKQHKEWVQGIARSDYKGLLRKTITGLSRLQTSRVTIKQKKDPPVPGSIELFSGTVVGPDFFVMGKWVDTK